MSHHCDELFLFRSEPRKQAIDSRTSHGRACVLYVIHDLILIEKFFVTSVIMIRRALFVTGLLLVNSGFLIVRRETRTPILPAWLAGKTTAQKLWQRQNYETNLY